MRERALFQQRRAATALQRAGEQRASVLDVWLRAATRRFDQLPRREAVLELRELLRSLGANAEALTSPKHRAAARVAFHALRRLDLGQGTVPAAFAPPARTFP